MNKAQSRRLRMCCLLLLAPLLVAGTPSPLSGTRSLSRLEFRNVPPSAMAGQPINVTVEARDSFGFVATEYSGTIQFRSTDANAVLPQRYTFNPARDRGRKTFPITFQSGGTWELVAQDVSNSNLRASAPNIPVRAEPATRLEIVGLPPDTFPGRPLSFQVLALDANGNPGSVSGELQFTTDAPEAAVPDLGSLQPSYTVTFYTPGTWTLWVTAVNSNSSLSTSTTIMVRNAQRRDVVVTPSVARLRTCEAVTLRLEAVDGSSEPVAVSLCRPDNRSATAVAVNNFISAVTTEQCVSGSFVGEATVVWENKVGESVPFTTFGLEVNRTVTVSWIPELNPELSSFLFHDTTEDIPKLPVSISERTLQLNLSDTCPQPLVLPPDKELAFSATLPLSIRTSYYPDTPGQWEVSVKLPECPADPTQPLAIWPTINGRELRLTGGERIERLVQPRCAAALELSVTSPQDGEKVEPGGLVELEVEISNKSPQPILNGVLRVSAEGLTVLEARLDGEPLTPQSGGFVIPELLLNSTVKVKIKAQATTNLEQVMNAKVWYADADGTPLTPEQTVDLTLNGLGVNVGCGCHAASLPSQLWPWLALLLGASRPWDRSRRLRRGERIDR